MATDGSAQIFNLANRATGADWIGARIANRISVTESGRHIVVRYDLPAPKKLKELNRGR